jgi:hypothetical protein
MSKKEVEESLRQQKKGQFFESKELNMIQMNNLNHTIPVEDFFPQPLLDDMRKTKQFKLEKATTPKGYVDLREFDTSVKSQDNGKCTAYSLIALWENLCQQKYGKGSESCKDISEWDLWRNYRKYSCDAAIKAFSKNYVADENFYPQYGNPKQGIEKNRHAIITSYAYRYNDINAVIEGLDNNRPVYFATTVTKSLLNCDTTVYAYSQATDGGHGISIVGYGIDKDIPGGGYFIYKNSWGPNCADKGYQYLPFYHCQRNDTYCAFWDVTGIKSTKTFNDIDPTPTPNPEPPKYQCIKWGRKITKPSCWFKECCLEWGYK